MTDLDAKRHDEAERIVERARAEGIERLVAKKNGQPTGWWSPR